MIQDLRFAVRVFARNPGFASLAVAALALGIGANTAVFTVVDGVVLRPLRFEKPDELVRIFVENPAQGRLRYDVAPADFVSWKKEARAFERVAAVAGRPFTLAGGEPEQILAMLVTADFFSLLRATTILGRPFLPEEYESQANAAFGMILKEAPGVPAVVLGHGLW